MIRIAVLGEIGSGKSYFAKQLNIPLFNADAVVANLYFTNKFLFSKLKKIFPKYIGSFPIQKNNLIEIISANRNNLKKIIKIVHPLVRKEMLNFLKKNKKQKAVVLDIPLFLENKLNLKNDLLVYIHADKNKILNKLKKRNNFNIKIFKLLKLLQLPLSQKKEMADFVINNNFNSAKIKKEAKTLLNKILI
ncbi:MAG: dephospho-CoA kinase [Pelagibacteraceae bacterium]|nr:dephospho-CoA kinase [Pelagibacteraceae bacterium]